MSRCHGTPTIDACHNLVQLLLPLYSSHVHMVHGATTALCNIEASSSLDCSKLKTDEIVPIFTGGPGNPVQRPRRIFHEIGREISSREDE